MLRSPLLGYIWPRPQHRRFLVAESVGGLPDPNALPHSLELQSSRWPGVTWDEKGTTMLAGEVCSALAGYEQLFALAQVNAEATSPQGCMALAAMVEVPGCRVGGLADPKALPHPLELRCSRWPAVGRVSAAPALSSLWRGMRTA
ncbi:hypothetical protein NDU88_002982 [Pleurodeles waltl]|uniref:Uncharacterized protein n=1 Tax=Pleurodeles waltl TaxID=8319 RepID=A0AAV7SFE1_PLEWA|nr:hypothetical protein NDU88_002982 [Pleurodeles waltl]